MVQKTYIICSTYTKAPYIDAKRNASIYLDEKEAKEQAGKLSHVTVVQKEGDGKHILSYCYAAGAKYIQFQGKLLKITDKNIERRFYNGDPNADISRYVHTKNNLYLEDLRHCSFIMPIRIRNTPTVSAAYATVIIPPSVKKAHEQALSREKKKGRSKGKPWFFLAFTDIEEYEKWVRSGGGPGWNPLKVDFSTMRRIGEGHGFLLNVRGIKLELPPEKLKKIEKGERNAQT